MQCTFRNEQVSLSKACQRTCQKLIKVLVQYTMYILLNGQVETCDSYKSKCSCWYLTSLRLSQNCAKNKVILVQWTTFALCESLSHMHKFSLVKFKIWQCKTCQQLGLVKYLSIACQKISNIWNSQTCALNKVKLLLQWTSTCMFKLVERTSLDKIWNVAVYKIPIP